MLARNEDLTLLEIMLLDQLQKRKKISKESAIKLKEKSLIEGRYPNLYISEQIAGATGEMTQYIKNRGFQKEHYKKMIIEFLTKCPKSTRKDIDDLIINLLPGVLTEKQKKKKVENLIYELSKKDNKIINVGNSKNPEWILNT